jgi:hypothetical protein
MIWKTDEFRSETLLGMREPDDIRDAKVLYTTAGGEMDDAADGRAEGWA